MKALESPKPRAASIINRAAHALLRAGTRRLNPLMLSLAGDPPLADACRNPSPGTALRAFLYNAPGPRGQPADGFRDPAHLWRAGRLVPQRASGGRVYDTVERRELSSD